MTLVLPKARLSPATNTIGGITFADPYQWLEATTEETAEWQSAQDEAAREYIRAWPAWRILRDAVERSMNAGQGFVFPAYHDGLWISGRDLSGASRILSGNELATVSDAGPRVRRVQHGADARVSRTCRALPRCWWRLRDRACARRGRIRPRLVDARPDGREAECLRLFRVVVAQVPLLDLLRAGRFALLLEFGDPQNPSDARVLAAYSPYHNVREAPYPSVLLDAGENDPRCRPWHARKMAARLQDANRSDHPILLRVWRDAGHVGANKSTQIDQSTDWLAFVMQELGMEPSGV